MMIAGWEEGDLGDRSSEIDCNSHIPLLLPPLPLAGSCGVGAAVISVDESS